MNVYDDVGDLVLHPFQRHVLSDLISSFIAVARPAGELSSDEAIGLVQSFGLVAEVFPETVRRGEVARFYGRLEASARLKRGEAGTYRQLAAEGEQAFVRMVRPSKAAV